MGYIFNLLSVLFRHGLLWWSTLVIAYVLGIGIFSDYDSAREKLRGSGIMLPDEFSFMWIVLPFMAWLVMSLAHKVTMLRLRAGKIVIDDPVVLPDVPLYSKLIDPKGGVVGQKQMGKNDIVYVNVRNRPTQMSNGKEIKDAYGSVSIRRLTDDKEIVKFDYPRWMNNKKPGYEGSPSDHYPDEWNFRTLHPNNSPNRLDMIVKSRDEDNAYGFRGASQNKDKWHDNDLKFPPGSYKIMLTLYGTGMIEPYIACYEFNNPGAEKELKIRRTDRGLTTPWLEASTTV